MKNNTVKIFSSIEQLASYSADFLIKKVNTHSSNIKFSVAVSGGSTPERIFGYIADNYSDKINWNNINIFFGDERCVPPNSNESNFKMINNALFRNSFIPSKNIFRIKGEKKPTEEIVRYSKIIKNKVGTNNGFPQFDIVMLGVGTDGHTASIFPNQIEMFYTDNICEIATHPQSGQKRITITGKIINNAKLVVFFVTGANKSKIISTLLTNNILNPTLPASLVKPTNGKLVWLLGIETTQLLNSETRTT